MNKAFIREPDDTGQRYCPACQSLGVPLGRETWQAHVVEAAADALADTAYFCPYARCDVAYFDIFERVVRTGALREPVFPKDPQAPICACFGFTLDEIEADVREGSVARTRALVERAKGPEAQCRVRAASGQSCVADVQRHYMKLRGATGG
jgi:hypothetical protein